MLKFVACNCGEDFYSEDPEPQCSSCGLKITKSGREDWEEVYNMEVNKPLAKPGGGEKGDKTHSRIKSAMRKISKYSRMGGFRPFWDC